MSFELWVMGFEESKEIGNVKFIQVVLRRWFRFPVKPGMTRISGIEMALSSQISRFWTDVI